MSARFTPAGGTASAVSTAIRDPWLPTSAIAQTFQRFHATGNLALTSGTLRLSGGLVLPANQLVTSITVMAGGQSLAVGTHQWFALFDAATRAKLAVTSDDTSTAWALNTAKTLNLASTYTPTTDKQVYVGVLVTATTMPFLLRDGGANSNAGVLGPALGGTSTAALTDPASAPSTAAAPSGDFGFYAYVS